MYCSSSRSTQRIMFAGALGGLHDLPRVEALIERASRQELRKASEIDVVGRHSGNHDRGALRGFAVGPDVTGGAVQRDAVEPQRAPLRCAGRPVHPGLEDKAERLPALTGQVVAAQLRQRLEDPGRNTGEPVAAGRSVFELPERVVEMLFGDVAVIVVIKIPRGRDEQQHCDAQNAPAQAPDVAQHRGDVRDCSSQCAPEPRGGHRYRTLPARGARLGMARSAAGSEL